MQAKNIQIVDRCFDYLPIVSTISNSLIIGLKIYHFVYSHFHKEELNPQSSPFIYYAVNKSNLRCFAGLIPFALNIVDIISAIYRYYQASGCSSEQEHHSSNEKDHIVSCPEDEAASSKTRNVACTENDLSSEQVEETEEIPSFPLEKPGDMKENAWAFYLELIKGFNEPVPDWFKELASWAIQAECTISAKKAAHLIVKCYQENDEHLALSDLSLKDLPPVIGNLTHLTKLYCSGMHLKTLPTELIKLTKLKRLSCRSMNWESLPPIIWKLTNLVTLEVNDGSLKSIPKEIGNLTNIQVLYLNSNCLKSIPAEIGKLTNLVVLNINHNRLESVPKEIGNLTNIQRLYLNNNHLKSIPKEMGNLTDLQLLYLENNQLEFTPEEISNCISMSELHLHNNPQLDDLPISLGELEHLTYVSTEGTGISRVLRRNILKACQAKRCRKPQDSL